jgi:hypothetical protein
MMVMIDGLIPTNPAEYDFAFGPVALPCHDAVEADTWTDGSGALKPDRPDAYAALASALVEAGLVEPSADHPGRAPFIDLAVLEAITRRQGLPGRIGRLIREYLCSLSGVTSPLFPTSVLVNGTIEISTWSHEVGRMPRGPMQERACR